MANALLRLGNKKGDRLSLVLPNIPELIIAYMACYKAGLVAVGVNPRYTMTELSRNLEDNKAVTVIVSADQADKIENIYKTGDSSVKNIIVVDICNDWSGKEGIFEFYELLRDEIETEPEINIFPEDLQILVYTGGTTGVSKGCCYTNKAIVGHANAWINWFSPALEGKDLRILVCLPMSHAYAIQCGITWPIVAGGTVIVEDCTKRDTILDDINRYEPTVWPSVPALINQLVYNPNIRESKIGSIAIVLCGSAPPSVDTITHFKKVTKARLVEGFGMSESVTAVTFNPVMGEQKIGCIGIPISDTDVLIVDLEQGTKVMPEGEKGEIIFRGPQRIQEYWEQPGETAKAIRDGWLYTGDIGYMDKDGYCYIVDRKKDMINVGGFNVYPREIDETLFAHPRIYEACTVGVPHPRLGEVAMSFIVLMPGETLTEDEVIVYCRERLAAYKVPKKVEFLKEIPKTNVNKPDKNSLRQIAERAWLQMPQAVGMDSAP